MRVVLTTYRDIGWIVKAYVHLHEKYWGVPVDLVAEEDYSEGHFNFMCPPNEGATAQVNGVLPCAQFSDVLIWYLNQIDDRFVVVMLADYLIKGPVDTLRLGQLEEYMSSSDNILRGQVGDDTGFCNGRPVDTYKDIDICEGGFYPASLVPGMWNRELMLEMLEPSQNPWIVERHGQDVFEQSNWRSLAIAPGIMPYVNALRGRNLNSIVLTKELYNEVKEYIRIPWSGQDG